MANVLINPLGEDSEKGGIFFGSNLTPAGTFSNTPKYYKYSKPDISNDGNLVLTLQKIKDSLKDQIKLDSGADADDAYVEKYLYEFTNLLIDYRDMRNYVFYGSANTELAYNIKKIIDTFPYKFWIATETTSLNTPDALIEIVNDVANSETSFIFSETAIKDGIEQFNFFDNSTDFDWNKYEVIDKNSNRYKIKSVTTPYLSSTSGSVNKVVDISIGTQLAAIDNTYNPPVSVNDFPTIQVTTLGINNYTVGEVISLKNIFLKNGVNIKSLQDEYVISQLIDPYSFLIINKYKANEIANGGKPRAHDSISFPSGYIFDNTILDSLVRKYPSNLNTSPYSIKIIIQGNFFENYLESYNINGNEDSGFIISPTKTILSEFEFNLTQIQKILLSPEPINPTPWPRRNITNNIQNLMDASNWNIPEIDFVNWIQNPDVLFMKSYLESDDDISFSDVFAEYRLVRALSLDETETNQLVRRCIPQDFLSELNDTPEADFQRFILIAGWFFDQVRLYVKFLKYVHHINTTDFNQISPEYYRQYASHYGLDLFTDDGIDFSKLVVKTEPGLYFREKALEEKDTKFYSFTLQQLQYERQKRLLISLFYLYKSKGTKGTIEKLVSLLGSPDGFFQFNEYAFKINTTDEFDYYDYTSAPGSKIADNEKVKIPEYEFEIDPNYPVLDATMPPVYRMRLKNESTYNLRQVSILTNPNGAIDNQIINLFGKTKHKYVKFNKGEFANLQNLKKDYSLNEPYHILPLTIPDKFFGMAIEYMIPKEGFIKGVGNNLEEVNLHLCSLYQIQDSLLLTPSLSNVYVYPVPEQLSNYNLESFKSSEDDSTIETDLQPNVQSDFSLLSRYMKGDNSIALSPAYLICRLEGKDLVIRAKLPTEIPSSFDPDDIGERVALMPNVFEADGLNHSLRFIFRPEGVEIYQDYKHLGVNHVEKIGICLWRNPSSSSTNTYFEALEIPKYLISSCDYSPYSSNLFIQQSTNLGNDIPKGWDMFIGLPVNIDFNFKKVTLFENYAIDSFNDANNIKSINNYTGEYWSFSMSDNEGDINDVVISCEYSQIEPNIAGADFSYQYPVEQFNNKIVVKDLKLRSKQLFSKENQKYFYTIQDFFNVKKVFEENAYMKNIHQSYDYENFNGKLIKLYSLYSPQVLSYDSLTPFLELIENKFRPLIKDFIPIVINISEFGRLITNSLFIQPKIHYTNIHKKCVGKIIGNSLIQVRFFEQIKPGYDFNLEIENSDGSSLIPPTPISWMGTMGLTEFEILTILRSPSVNPNKERIKILVNDGVLAIIVNSLWYNDTYGMDSNDLKFIITNTSIVEPPVVINFDYGSIDTSNNTCGSIEHRLPSRNLKDVFVYFAEENQPETFIYFDSESSSNNTYLNFD